MTGAALGRSASEGEREVRGVGGESAPRRSSIAGRGLHLFACLTALATFFLIIAGALVTSTGSGLAVPDWPLSYGMVMPPMVGGIFYEHGHRMVACVVAILTTVLTIWLARREPRRWVRVLGYTALGAVLLQALLGGITVLLLLPTAVSASHATLGQTFFCLTVVIALVTSPLWASGTAATTAAPAAMPRASDSARGATPATWLRGEEMARQSAPGAAAWLALIAVAAVYIQLIIGAVMRHMEAGLAIPDFPLSFGRLLPPHWSPQIGIHFAHRAWGLLVLGLLLSLASVVRWTVGKRSRAFAWFASLLGTIVSIQVAFGALTVLSLKQTAITTAHVATGAALLATCVVMAILLWRPAFQR